MRSSQNLMRAVGGMGRQLPPIFIQIAKSSRDFPAFRASAIQRG